MAGTDPRYDRFPGLYIFVSRKSLLAIAIEPETETVATGKGSGRNRARRWGGGLQ